MSAAVDYKLAVTSPYHGPPCPTHTDRQHKGQCVKTGARLPQLGVLTHPAASRFIVISIALNTHARIYIKNKQTKNSVIMLWTASQVLRKFSTSSVSNVALAAANNHRDLMRELL